MSQPQGPIERDLSPPPWALPKPPSSSHFPLSQRSLFPVKQSLLISLSLSFSLGSPAMSISRPSVLPLLPPTSLFIFPRRKMKAKWWPSSRKVSAGWRRPLRPRVWRWLAPGKAGSGQLPFLTGSQVTRRIAFLSPRPGDEISPWAAPESRLGSLQPLGTGSGAAGVQAPLPPC